MTDDARFHRLSAKLDELLDLEPPQRAAVLGALAQQEPDFARELEALLEAGEAPGPLASAALGRAGSLLARSPAAPVDVDADDGPAPTSAGPFRLLRRIGRGGMGEVWLAERSAADFDQQVALKLLRPGVAGATFEARFRRERAILARLEHPNIARFVDGGVAADGRLYFAMDLVDGVPITDFAAPLDLEQRLRLFLSVCDAVEFAHRNLVVHRDLKPSNVLVAKDGTVKLLDFGIAKLLAADDSEAETFLTERDERMMTPSYAAPEQILGGAVTTATDIYALGALLHELLTGERPFEAPSRMELERAIVHTEPRRPSSRPSSRALSSAGARRLRGDLDAIVLQALRKEPERRYRSVEALAADLSAFLDGRPVAARGDSMGYRGAKFLRRHRLGVAAAAIVVAALVGGLAIALWQARVARAEAGRAEAVKKFLVDLFAVADPEVAQGKTLTAQEVLERGAARVESELAGQPAVRAELQTAIARIDLHLGLYDASQAEAEKAVALARDLPGQKGLLAAGLTALGETLYLKEEQAPAEAALREALALLRPRGDETSLEVAALLGAIGKSRHEQGELDDALRLHLEALALQRELAGADSLAVAKTMAELAAVDRAAGRYQEAVDRGRQAQVIARKVLGDDHPFVGDLMESEGEYLEGLGRMADAEQQLQKTLVLRTRLLGPDHPDVAGTKLELAWVYRQLGREDEAATLFPQVLAIYGKVFGVESPQYANVLNDQALAADARGDSAGAARTMETVLAIWKKTLGERNPNYLTGLNNLGVILRKGGEYERAEVVLRQALTLRREVLGEEHPNVAEGLANLATVLRIQGRPTESLALESAALAANRKAKSADDPQVSLGILRCGQDEATLGRFAEAEAHLRDAVARYPPHPGVAAERNEAAAEAEVALGKVLVATARAREAEPLLAEAVAWRARELGETHWRTAEARFELGLCYRALGRGKESAALLEASLRRLREAPPEGQALARRAAGAPRAVG